MKNYLKITLLGFAIALITTVITAAIVYAQGIGTSAGAAEDPGSVLNALIEAWQGGGWMAALGVAVGVAVRFARPRAAKKIAWLKTPIGGYVFTFVLSAAAGIGEALTMGALSWATVGAILVAALTSLATTPGQDQRTVEVTDG